MHRKDKVIIIDGLKSTTCRDDINHKLFKVSLGLAGICLTKLTMFVSLLRWQLSIYQYASS